MEKIADICGKLCPQTLSINFAAFAISMTELEAGLKIISYAIAIIYTVLKIRKELRDYKKNG